MTLAMIVLRVASDGAVMLTGWGFFIIALLIIGMWVS